MGREPYWGQPPPQPELERLTSELAGELTVRKEPRVSETDGTRRNNEPTSK